MKVYVVLSDSIINGHSSHGLHGVYADKEQAKVTAISVITSIAGQNISVDDVYIEDDNEQLELFYNQNGIDIVVSCIMQNVQA